MTPRRIDSPAALVQEVAEQKPGAYRLAMLASLAARIEPQLVRALRLDLAQDLTPWDEAQLWFSPLVATQTASGLVLEKDVVPILRRALETSGQSQAAWAVIERVHRGGSAALLAEEELGYLALRGVAHPAARARATELLRQLVAGMVTVSADNGAQWAHQALARLPEALFDIPEAKMLALGSAYRGAAVPDGLETALQEATGNGAWLRPPDFARQKIGVRLVDGGVEIGPTSMEKCHALALPPLRRPALHLAWQDGSDKIERRVAAVTTQTQFVPCQADEIEITVVGDETYRLSRPKLGPGPGPINRPARVRVGYTDPMDSGHTILPPFIIGVLADLFGNVPPKQDLYERQFRLVDVYTLDTLMAELEPRIDVTIDLDEPSNFPARLRFRALDDFAPAALVAQLPQGKRTLDDRRLVSNALADPSQVNADDLFLVLDRFESGARFESLPPDDTDARGAILQDVIVKLDTDLGRMARALLSAEPVRRLEAAWRGLAYLVHNVETSAEIQIKVLPVTWQEVANDMPGSGRGGVLEAELVLKPRDTLGETPFGCVVADFQLGTSSEDVRLADALAQLGEVGMWPLIANAAPDLFGAKDWSELLDSASFSKGEANYVDPAFQELRQSDWARFLGLCAVRHLGREPYGWNSALTEDAFDFEELSPDFVPSELLWVNPCYAMTINIARAVKEFGWPVRIRGVQSGGEVRGLPTVMQTRDDSLEQIVLEQAVTDRAEAMLSQLGLLPLVHRQNTDMAAFIGGQSFAQPMPDPPDQRAVAGSALRARLPYTFAQCVFGRVALCMARDLMGSVTDKDQLETMLQSWINQYVNVNPETESQAARARHPLSHAKVEIDEGSRGGYILHLTMTPTYQMEGMDVANTLVVTLPASGSLSA